MRIECDVIQDILPLYMEKISSEASNRLVEEHVKSCEKCRSFLKNANVNLELETSQPEAEIEKKVVKKSYKKLFLRLVTSILISVVLILVVGKIVYNHVTLHGFSIYNIDEAKVVHDFMECIMEQDYEAAVAYQEQSYKSVYGGVLGMPYGENELFDMTHGDVTNASQEEYVQYRKDTFLERMDRWDEHTKILSYKIVEVYSNSKGHIWHFEVAVTQESLTDGEVWESTLQLNVKGKDITDVSGAFIRADDPWWDICYWISISDVYHK